MQSLEATIRATRDKNRVTPEGAALGAQLVRLTEPVIQRLVAEGEPDERCGSCAFRLGTVPNGCVQTQMDALKAVMEGSYFLCHMRLEKETPCHGWYAGRIATRDMEPLECPWPFSADTRESLESPQAVDAVDPVGAHAVADQRPRATPSSDSVRQPQEETTAE